MNSARLIALWLVVALCLPAFGCGLFRRRASQTTNVSSSVEVNQQGRDVATLERDEYEVIETSIGRNKSVSVFVLTLPVGSQTLAHEQVDSAYYQAVDRLPECDALLLPRIETKRTIVPLLLVNVIVRKVTVKGRCLHIKDTLPADVVADTTADGGSEEGGDADDEVAGTGGADTGADDAGEAPAAE